jgi:FkbM family methyltransferase
MIRRVSTVFRKALYRLQRLICPNEKQRLYNEWFGIKGDRTLRVDYPLTRDSLVFDVGGYMGSWAADIRQTFGCTLFVFEPVRSYAEKIRERFKNDPHVHVFEFGLGSRNRVDRIGLSDDASSLFHAAAHTVEIEIRDVVEFLRQQHVDKIDLMKINIEGGEYELLEALLQSGLCAKVDNFQIQFHDFVPNAEARMAAVQSGLGKTHDLTWQYRFIWENWRLRSLNSLGDK